MTAEEGRALSLSLGQDASMFSQPLPLPLLICPAHSALLIRGDHGEMDSSVCLVEGRQLEGILTTHVGRKSQLICHMSERAHRAVVHCECVHHWSQWWSNHAAKSVTVYSGSKHRR